MQLHMHTETDKSQLNVWAALACLASTNGTETDNGHREAMQLHTDTHRRNKQVSTQCIGQQANKPWPVLLLPSTERQTMATGEAMQPHTHTEKKDKSQPTVSTFRDKQWPEGMQCNCHSLVWKAGQQSTEGLLPQQHSHTLSPKHMLLGQGRPSGRLVGNCGCHSHKLQVSLCMFVLYKL